MATYYQPPYAQIHFRLAAWLLDSFILGVFSIASYFTLYSAEQPTTWFVAEMVFPAIYYLLPMVIFHTTPGKRILNLRIVMQDESPLRPDAAILRYLVFFLTSMIPLGLILSGFMIFVDPERRTFHDRLAKTIVVSSYNRF